MPSFQLTFRGTKTRLQSLQAKLEETEEIQSLRIRSTENARPSLLDRNSNNQIELLDVVIVFILNKGFDQGLERISKMIKDYSAKEDVECSIVEPIELNMDETEGSEA